MSEFQRGSFKISDDGFDTITPNTESGIIIITIPGLAANRQGIVSFDVDSGGATTVLISPTGDIEVTTGALAGTTGTDVKLTISAHTDGLLYVENRLGAEYLIRYLLIS